MRFRIFSNFIFALWAAAAGAQTITIDNVDPGFSILSGTWELRTSSADKYGDDYYFSLVTGSSNGTPTAEAEWRPTFAGEGVYRVYVWYPQGANRSPDAPYRITHSQGTTTVRINQQSGGGVFRDIGRYHFNAGNTGFVRLGNDAQSAVVLADAVRFVYEPPAPEYRAFWTSRFEWPSATSTTAQSNIQTIFTDAKNYNFNAVVFQVRGQHDVHYPSPYEPWSNTYNWINPGWDPLQYAVDQAHSRGIEVHAYFNTHTLTGSGAVPPANTTPQHNHNLHGPNPVGGGSRWVIHSAPNAWQTSVTDGYFWLSPGIPEASWWTRRSLRHLITTYDVDGVHFDRIRTPANTYSHDPISEARFAGEGNPDDLDWGDFMRSQITRDLRNIYGEVQYYRPDLVVSSSPIGINQRSSSTQYQGVGNSAYFNYYQDTFAWLNAGVMDFVVPQIYWEINSAHPFEKLLGDWQANRGSRWIVAGSRTSKTVAANGPKPVAGLMAEQQQTRTQGAAGHCTWVWGELDTVPPGDTMDYRTAFRTTQYDVPTTIPLSPWKTAPTGGYITGYILDALGNPVVDARVNLAGDSYNYLSAYDGFFSILHIPPGANHTLTAFSLGKGARQQSAVTVTAGTVTSITLTLQPSRGVVDFKKPRYNFNESARVRVYDADLSGAGTIQTLVTSTAEPAGETVVLDESTTTPGLFEGNIQLQETASTSGDNRLRASPAGSLTAFYNDANDGAGNSVQRSDAVPILIPADIIVESRLPTGGTNTVAGGYSETVGPGGGTWTNTETVGANVEVIKSMAPGLYGMGGRYVGTNGVGAYATFTPRVKAPGFYNVYVTLPSGVRSANNVSPGAAYRITHDGGVINGTFDLSHTTTGLSDQWYLLASNVKFAAGTIGSIRLTNNNAGSSSTQRFNMDAVKLVFTVAIPVTVSAFEVE